MFTNAQDFLGAYEHESATTSRVLHALTDASLAGLKAAGHPSTGDIAWHLPSAICYILNQVDFKLPELEFMMPEGTTAAQIAEKYDSIVAQVREQAAAKTPEDLAKVYHVFGTYDWPAGMMLNALISHEIHHRGQISVLMRQAGLTVPSIYGPNFEETQVMMAKMAEGAAG